SGLWCGRPSARTVVSQVSSAVSSTDRAWSQLVASLSGSLKRSSSSVRGVVIASYLQGSFSGWTVTGPQSHRTRLLWPGAGSDVERELGQAAGAAAASLAG